MITDQFGRRLHDLRISVTDRCNFRCPYCMPAEVFGESYKFLPKGEILTFEEIARLTGIFAGLGVSKIRVTGGEPLLRNGLHLLIELLANIEGVEDLRGKTVAVNLGSNYEQLLRELPYADEIDIRTYHTTLTVRYSSSLLK